MRKTCVFLVITLLILAIVNALPSGSYVHFILIINYGNGISAPYCKYVKVRQVSFNLTAPLGVTLFNATLAMAKVTYRKGVYGIYITSINGVKERILSSKEGYSWLWYILDRTTGRFVLGPVACDKYVIKEGDVIMWKYSHWKF